jgi:hypothetical protein
MLKNTLEINEKKVIIIINYKKRKQENPSTFFISALFMIFCDLFFKGITFYLFLLIFIGILIW